MKALLKEDQALLFSYKNDDFAQTFFNPPEQNLLHF